MPAKSITPGTVFGKLTVLGISEPSITLDGKRISCSLCRCECGNEKSIRNHSLKAGLSQSCGCLKSERTAQRNFVHGHNLNGKSSKTLKSFRHMHERCYNPNNKKFHRYGGRGIVVCERWHEFPNFLTDLGEAPIGKTIDRINNDGNYSCGKCLQCTSKGWPMNCAWSTPKQQSRNQSTNRILTVRGITGPLAELAEKFQINQDLVWGRLKRGWEPERAFFAEKRINGVLLDSAPMDV